MIVMIVYGSVLAAILVAPLFIAWGFRIRTEFASLGYILIALMGILAGLVALTAGFESAFGSTSVYSPIGFTSNKGLILFFGWLSSFPLLIFSWLHFLIARTYPRAQSNQ